MKVYMCIKKRASIPLAPCICKNALKAFGSRMDSTCAAIFDRINKAENHGRNIFVFDVLLNPIFFEDLIP
jgi:hypothetical protein